MKPSMKALFRGSQGSGGVLEHSPLLNLILQLPGVDGGANQEVFHVLPVAGTDGTGRAEGD